MSKYAKKYDVIDASFRCVYMVFGMFSVHVEGCKNHMKCVAGKCIPSGKGFFQFMVDNMCPSRVAFTWGKILAGTFWGRGWTCVPWGEGVRRQSGWD